MIKRELTPKQVQQLRRLLKALQKAADNVGSASAAAIRARNKLLNVRYNLEIADRKVDDVRTSALAGLLDKEVRLKVMEIVRGNQLFATLHRFGSLPWQRIKPVFDTANIECPIELTSFHDAYQEELKPFLEELAKIPDPIGYAYMG